MNEFKTQTNDKLNARRHFASIFIAYAVMAIVASALLSVTLNAFIFVEAIIFIVFLFCTFLSMSANKNKFLYLLHFENDTLHITESNTLKSWDVWDIPASDFAFFQSDKQKSQNVGDIKIKDTIFHICNIENFEEMKAYIFRNYKR